MDIITPLLLAIGLARDCFAVSLAIGTTTRTRLVCAAGTVALSFGFFQAGMSLIGWVVGASIISLISGYDHWIAFLLLLIIGVKMIWDGAMDGEEEAHIEVIALVPVLILSVATSIDALAVGVSFGILQSAILVPALIIGLVSFVLSFAGVMLGKRLGEVVGSRMEIIGGVILILLGTRILAGHLFSWG
jgi:putative Mn2+ efflux pump MntP